MNLYTNYVVWICITDSTSNFGQRYSFVNILVLVLSSCLRYFLDNHLTVEKKFKFMLQHANLQLPKFKSFFQKTHFSIRGTSSNPVVTIKEGQLRGREVTATSFQKKKYFAFQGIPYAQPPVGKLRFNVGTVFDFYYVCTYCLC